MDISVIIVTWNTRGSLAVCLESLYAQASGLELEVFVADNGSSDGTAEELRRTYPEVQLLEGHKNIGFARAANQALRLVQAPYVLMLHVDARILPGALPALLRFLQEHPEAGAAGAQAFGRDGSRQRTHAKLPSLLRELFMPRLPLWGKRRNQPVKAEDINGPCVLLRHKAIADIGLLDEAYFLFYEFSDWCARLRKAGWDAYLIPEARVVHDAGRSVFQDRKNARIEACRSRYLYFKKHKPAWQLLGLRAGTVLRALLTGSWDLLFWHLRACPRWAGLGAGTVARNTLALENGKANISACLITRNEEANVRECLESLRFASEIIVIDSFSEDRTPEICREFTDKVFQSEWIGFSGMKNLCVEQASNPWVLVIDADERVTPELRAEMLDCKKEADGFYLPRENYFLGKWMRHAGWYPDYTLRWFKKGAGKFGDRKVHEAVRLQGKALKLRNPLRHYTYRDLNAYVARLNRYSTLAAEQMKDEMPATLAKSRWLPLRLIADITLRPVWNFFKMYVLQLGFLDGVHGFLLCTHASFYVLAKYAKLWELMFCPSRVLSGAAHRLPSPLTAAAAGSDVAPAPATRD